MTDPQLADQQTAVIELLDAFHDHDKAALAKLTPDQRAEQVSARGALFRYVDAIWEGAKARGLSPADLPAYDSVAAMRDLTEALLRQHAVPAQMEAGEYDLNDDAELDDDDDDER